MSEGPYELSFAQIVMNGLKIPQKGEIGVGTADLKMQNVHGITRLMDSSTGNIEVRLVVIDSAASPNLTEEPLEFDVVGKLENATQKEEFQETPGRSRNAQSPLKTWLESFLNANYGNPDLSFTDVMLNFGSLGLMVAGCSNDF